ncbi:MAG TPA: substrate-binding domain-containing protein [Steroidobacteraceae bacterium]|nr:substrate-binding domain-containing protein [Steroidobacteraceae bacterium]
MNDVVRAPLKLLSSMATRDVLRELVARYVSDTARAVSTEAAGGVDVARRVRDGEAVDIVVLASNTIDQLIDERKLHSRVDLVNSGIAIAVRANCPRPEVGTEDEVKGAVLAAGTLSYSTGPSGVYLEKLFERWGVLETIRSRIVVPPPGVAVGSLIASGRVELGFQQLSELTNVPNVEIVGPLPPAIQRMTTFSGGISVASLDPAAARLLLEFMASPATAGAKLRHGLEPAART